MKYFRIILVFFFLSVHCIQIHSQREMIPVEGEWHFYKGNAQIQDVKDQDWERVSVPHTWNVQDGQDKTYYRGTGIYTTTLRLPDNFKYGKRLFLRFDGVSSVAEVYLNDKLIDTHKGAFNAFCVEITSHVKQGSNKLTVKVNNSQDKDLPPLSGDFTLFGGIYRPVSFIVLDPLCISPLDLASSGVYIRQTEVSDQSATLDITTKVMNGYTFDKKVQVRVTLFDGMNRVVTSASHDLEIPRAGVAESHQQLIVKNPELWNGLSNPYLYRAYFEVLEGDVAVDTFSEFVGLRYFRIDPKEGFFLNGKPYKIKGVNKHQDRQGKGWAISKADIEEDVKLILEMGANAVRASHYPHADYFYTLCDRYGLLVWAENPLVDIITDSPEFTTNAKLQMTELIRQKYNHPSIVFWSLFNELNQKEGTGDPLALITALNELAHKEDPTRITVAAPNIEKRKENYVPEQIATNTYPGWYWGKPEDMKSSLQKWNKLMGEKGIGVSEYGAGASIIQHEENIKKAPVTTGKWHPEEWQAIVHELNYKGIQESPFVWGSFIWNMFDFASAGRDEGDTPGLNDKGLVTYDRKVKKDAFYFYKANWSVEPFAYITGRRNEKRKNGKTDVKIYSNCKQLKLYVNGADKGERSGENGIFSWKNVSLDEGSNLIYTVGTGSDETISDQCIWELNTKDK